ncbi:transporter substrate-binding domain-containing protein [Methylovirgula sp. 4M-Z18]|uniref:transporter substrate-binding domain-containing protein n=1 Tax=Methylovirgula sp. 4M-Z18 TaxID=2293567 RepID=UPI000E2ECB45|nr:transporter substrate-binding domain-containing protein [Methylovirgula sp. 4M-Z18]RFB79503.1 amino acid ABC transporter [Methylovirgula sp. 4M-Z18]
MSAFSLRMLLAAICVTVPLAAQAQSSKLDAILARGTLKVGTTGDYKPFSSFDKASGQFTGFDIDLAENLGKALGVKVEYVQTSWPNMMKDFEAGDFDVAMGGVSVTLERAKKGYFSVPYMREGKTPIARCADKDKFQTLSDIDKPDVHVVVNPGGTNEKFARANLKAAQIEVHSDNTTIFDEIVQGHADLMITDASETRYQQKLHPELCSIHPDHPFDFAEKAIWLQRDEDLKQFVDQWLHLIEENGTYRSISDKWL